MIVNVSGNKQIRMKTESELLQVVCDIYAIKLENYLSEDLVYESQWVLTPLTGKESF